MLIRNQFPEKKGRESRTVQRKKWNRDAARQRCLNGGMLVRIIPSRTKIARSLYPSLTQSLKWAARGHGLRQSSSDSV